MRKVSVFILTALAALLATSCAKIYYSSDAKELVANHKTVAILPPSVSIAARGNVDAAALVEQQKAESVNFQREIYSWMLRRQMQGGMDVSVQDVETTNARLRQAGYPDKILTPAEMCRIVGTEGVITSTFALSKPMSTGAAIVTTILIGFGTTNEVSVSMNIRDCSADKAIWTYDHKFSGELGSTPQRLVDGLMRNASKKMPYME